MTGIYRFAELNISISSIYDEVHLMCKDYAAFCPQVDFSIKTDLPAIDFERERSKQEDEREKMPVRSFADPYLETLAVYRKIAEIIPEYNAMLMHGSCVAVDGKAYLFIAKSGTGKSTHTRLWREYLKDKVIMVNDDKPLVRLIGDELRIYGTPWDGKHRLSTNTSVPLKAVCILERGKDNSICAVSRGEAYPMLLQQTYRPMDPEALGRTVKLIDLLSASVSLWRMKCNMDIEAAKMAYEAMKG